MADGSLRRIDSVSTGERVVSHTGQPRVVLSVRTGKHTGKMLRFRPNNRGWVTASDDTRWLWLGEERSFSAPVEATGNGHCVVGRELECPFDPSLRHLIYCRLTDCSFASTKKRVLFGLEVEEEHSYGVVTDSGSVAVFARC
jgi:hypothetical protein